MHKQMVSINNGYQPTNAVLPVKIIQTDNNAVATKINTEI